MVMQVQALAQTRAPDMPALRVLLVDDEPLARARLRMLLQQLAPGGPACEVAGEAQDAQQALQWLRNHAADVILLDIHMPGLDGVALARQLRQGGPSGTAANGPQVIFITAHPEHALEAFEVEAVDYLPKPVNLQRLRVALARVARLRWLGEGAASAASAAGAEALSPPSSSQVITASHRGVLRRIPIQEALYFKSELKYVTLRTATEQHLLDDSLLDLEQRLGPAFLRVHRNALVAVDAIDALERREHQGLEVWSVRVRPVNEWIDVSRRQVAAVRKVLLDRSL